MNKITCPHCGVENKPVSETRSCYYGKCLWCHKVFEVKKNSEKGGFDTQGKEGVYKLS